MKLRIVLVRPRYAGNVGAVVRLAANFAVPEVTLVAPACPLDDPEFVRMAMGAEKLVRVAEAADLAAAIADTRLAIATTSGRERDRRAIHSPSAAADLVRAAVPDVAALVFGAERSGLTQRELRVCHATLSVPTNPEFPVLNLAQAVAIVVWAVQANPATAAPSLDPLDGPASVHELQAALAHMSEVMLSSGFLDPNNPARVMDQFQRWFGRTVPTRREIALLHALTAHMAYLEARSPRNA